ncbi:MAG: universal stress protein, partial [Cytophagaceae bacterium]
MAYQHIVIAVDSSPYSRKATQAGFDLARACGAQVMLSA